MVRRLGFGKNNHLTYASLALNPRYTFRHLKHGLQEFHRKYVLVSDDKAANNVVVGLQLLYINTLEQELSGTKYYKESSKVEKSVVLGHCNHLALKFSVSVREQQGKFSTMYCLLRFIKKKKKKAKNLLSKAYR